MHTYHGLLTTRPGVPSGYLLSCKALCCIMPWPGCITYAQFVGLHTSTLMLLIGQWMLLRASRLPTVIALEGLN